MIRSSLLALVAGVAAAHAAPPAAPKIPLSQHRLENGLQILVVEDHKAPVVTVQVFYHAGAKDEPADKRGIAHMFEHMLFKGSKHVPPEEHARYIDALGGDSNAFTTEDVTAYHDTVPPSAFEFAVKLEAERMRNLVLTQKTIDSEREVVKEELRVRLENNPVMQAVDKVLKLAFTKHPYQQLAIGQKQMLDTVSIEDCRRFYDTYYHPRNATLVVVGDIDEARVVAAAKEHFGRLPAGPEAPRVSVVEPEQTSAREATLELPVQLPVTIGGYHIPGAGDADLFALEVLQQVLSGGDSARMHQRLVRKDKSAVAAGGFVFAHEDPGLFVIFAAYLPTSDADKVRAALVDEIQKIGAGAISPRELQKAKNQLAAQAVYRRERVTAMATQLGTDALMAHDATRTFTAAARYDAVTAADVMRVARKYLKPTNLSLVTLKPSK